MIKFCRRLGKIIILALIICANISPSFAVEPVFGGVAGLNLTLPQILEKAINHFSLLKKDVEIVETRMEKKKGSEFVMVVKDGPALKLDARKYYWRVEISASLRQNEAPLNFGVLIDSESGAIVSN